MRDCLSPTIFQIQHFCLVREICEKLDWKNVPWIDGLRRGIRYLFLSWCAYFILMMTTGQGGMGPCSLGLPLLVTHFNHVGKT
jgi:hypothetical protein